MCDIVLLFPPSGVGWSAVCVILSFYFPFWCGMECCMCDIVLLFPLLVWDGVLYV